MNRNRVTVRYARALLEAAIEQDVLHIVDQDINLITHIFKQYKGFSVYISLPKVPSVEKFRKLSSILNVHIHPLSQQFLRLVFYKGRELFLFDICRNFSHMAMSARNIASATLVLAAEPNPDLPRQVKNLFEKKLETTLELETQCDPSILGGFIFTLNGWQYDASIASALKTIQKQLQAE